jgi:hypothetical protein
MNRLAHGASGSADLIRLDIELSRQPCVFFRSRARDARELLGAAAARLGCDKVAATPMCSAAKDSRVQGHHGGIQVSISGHSAHVQGRRTTFRATATFVIGPSSSHGGHAMRKTLIAVAAAATIAVATVATPTTADARRGWWGPALGAFAVGAIVGSAFARPYYGGYYGGYYPSYSYYPAYGYGYAPASYGYAYAPGPYYGCWRWRYGYRYRVC